MKQLLPILFLLVLASCNDSGNPIKYQTNKDTLVSSDSIVARDNLLVLSEVNYNYGPNTKLTPWQGNKKASAYWRDKRGENIIIISELPQYFWNEIKPEMGKHAHEDEDTEVAELFAYHYIYNQILKKWKIYWALNDFQFSCCDIAITYLPGTLKISDIDSNSKAESIFSYYSAAGTISPDLNYRGKLMFHIDSVKYSVKGIIGLYRNVEDFKAPNKYSDNFKSLNITNKTYFEKMWQRTIVIRDSIDNVIKKQWEK